MAMSSVDGHRATQDFGVRSDNLKRNQATKHKDFKGTTIEDLLQIVRIISVKI